jgi:peptidoglycan/LPS O-acetylase OafA/YrhL
MTLFFVLSGFGDASYSIYLVHYLVLMVTIKLIGQGTRGVVFNSVALAVSIAAVLAVSVALYKFYESPARKWLRGLWRTKT